MTHIAKYGKVSKSDLYWSLRNASDFWPDRQGDKGVESGGRAVI